MKKDIYSALMQQARKTTLETMKVPKWPRRKRREALRVLWPRRWWWYGFLLAVGFVAGAACRVWYDFPWAFQVGRMVGGLE